MKRFAVLISVLFLGLAGCAGVNRKIPMVNQPWVITGKLISAETGQPLSGRTVQLLRGQPGAWWCGGCLGSFRTFLQVTSNANGGFYFSSTVPGNYKVEAKCQAPNDGGVPNSDSVGEVSSGRHQLIVRYKEANCEASR